MNAFSSDKVTNSSQYFYRYAFREDCNSVNRLESYCGKYYI